MNRSVSLAAFGGLLLASTAGHAIQITPNPNPVGNTIVVEGGNTDFNAVPFVNDGDITIQQGNTVLAGGQLTNNAGSTLTNNGVIQSLVHPINSGIFINQGTVENNGSVTGPSRNDLGATFNNNATGTGGLTNFGQVTNNGNFQVVNGNTGVVDNYALLGNSSNDTGGVINNHAGATIRSGDPSQAFPFNLGLVTTLGTLNNDGLIEVNDGGTVTVQSQYWSGTFGSLHNSGSILVQGPGAVFDVEVGAVVDGTGSFTQDDGITRVQSATVDLGAGPVDFIGRLTQGEIVINGGTLAGTGVVESVNAPLFIGAAATISPGASPGTLTVEGDLDLEGTYLAQVDGIDLHDVINVTGTANLGSTSALQLVFGYEPAVDDSFDILVADSIIGDFGFVDATFPPPPDGGGCGESGCGEIFLTLATYSTAGYSYDLGLIVDAIGNLDVLRVIVTQVPAVVPVPAAAWLFAGALGALAKVRRRTAA